MIKKNFLFNIHYSLLIVLTCVCFIKPKTLFTSAVLENLNLTIQLIKVSELLLMKYFLEIIFYSIRERSTCSLKFYLRFQC